MTNLSSDQITLIQGIGLILGLPLLVISLGELIERCKRDKNPLGKVLNATRNLFLPLFTLWLVMRHFFDISEKAIILRIINSLYWLAFIYTILLLFNTLLATGKKQRLWQINVPNLLFQLLRSLMVLSIIAYVLAEIWKVDLTKVMGALGIGSLVIALALQDTLSNLVSGFLLIIESPFKLGDWIEVGDLRGEVIEINWRAVRLKTLDRDIIIIPNGNLGKENICNYSLLDPLHTVRLKMKFSYLDHPDLVRQILLEVALSVDGIQSLPLPEIDPQVYQNTYIEYEIRFCIIHYSQIEAIEDEFLRKAYYAIRRHHLQFPFADKIEYRIDRLPVDFDNTPEGIIEILRSLHLFDRLEQTTIQYLTQYAKVELFGVGEIIVSAGAFDRAFYVLLSGKVLLSVNDHSGKKQEITYLSEGEFVGEMVFLPGEPNYVSATVIETTKVIKIAPVAIAYLIQDYPKFALEMSHFIDERRKIIRIAKGLLIDK